MEIPQERPLAIAIAGPNGAGKSTFYATQLAGCELQFINADNLARQLALTPYKAAEVADRMRREFFRTRESFVFETVFSDPVGDKVEFLKSMEESGYRVVLCFIGISDADVSEQRVAMRVSQGGHDVPANKIQERYARTLANLKLALDTLTDVRVFDNDDLAYPYRLVMREGKLVGQMPEWLRSVLPSPDGAGLA